MNKGKKQKPQAPCWDVIRLKNGNIVSVSKPLSNRKFDQPIGSHTGPQNAFLKAWEG